LTNRDIELTWRNKSIALNEAQELVGINLPFQVIERINETQAARNAKRNSGLQRTLYDIWSQKEGDTFDSGWKNKLIWGENKYVIASLIKKYSGEVDLIYIDPPFATGADFSFTTTLNDHTSIIKEPTAIEQKAYRDTWGKGLESYLHMIYQRLDLMHKLLAPDGAIYVHMDYHIGHYVKVIRSHLINGTAG
jgi:adenine-specific DNA-methyltransferase